MKKIYFIIYFKLTVFSIFKEISSLLIQWMGLCLVTFISAFLSLSFRLGIHVSPIVIIPVVIIIVVITVVVITLVVITLVVITLVCILVVALGIIISVTCNSTYWITLENPTIPTRRGVFKRHAIRI